MVLAALGVLGALALFVMNGDDPSTPEDESRSCAESRLNEECVNGHPMCPAPKVCPTVDTTPQVVPSLVPEASSTTLVPELATVAPSTTVVAVAPRPNSEAAPKPTDAAPGEPPATEPPATDPAPQSPAPASCERPFTIQAGDNSWSIVADRLDVWTKDLLALNAINEQQPRIVGESWCAPPSVYGDGPATTQPQAPTTGTQPPVTAAAPTTLAPQAPPTEVATTAPPTTQQRRSPGGERTTTTIKPVWVQATTVAPAPTTKATQVAPKLPQAPPTSQAPVTTRVGPGTVRTTVPPV